MLLSNDKIQNTAIAYLPSFRKPSYFVYYTVLFIVISTLVALPLVNCTIGISATGTTRPVTERTEIKSFIGGMIDTIYYREGSTIEKGTTILRIKDRITKGKRLNNDFEIKQRQTFIHDLELLIRNEPTRNTLKALQAPLFRERLNHYLAMREDQNADLSKASKELNTSTQLYNQKVITAKEFADAKTIYDKADATSRAFAVAQQTTWQQDLIKYKFELSQYENDQTQVYNDASFYEVKAPVSGTLQDINNRYAGGVLQQGEPICSISPNGNIIGECYVSPRDIGLIKLGQIVHFQVDAFNYNYFGILTGKIVEIDNDYTVVNQNSFFKVRCSFDKKQMLLKNGYAGTLRKGLTFQSRFIIGERTLWQLLWDKLDDWLNPTAPKKAA